MSKIIENYLLKEVIGQGQYGKVYRSIHQKTHKVFAVKVIKIDKFKTVPKLQEFTINEIETLSKMKNDNVIQFIEMLRTQNNVYLIYEYCNGGTLEEEIKKDKFLKEQRAIKILQQIIYAFKSLYKHNILHRDLKPSNILFHNGVLKVADFGFCKSLTGPQDMTQTMVGSPIYMAPEILKGETYNIKADIWSIGVCFFETLFGYCPYEDRTIARLIMQINQKPLTIPLEKNNISKMSEDLLRIMLVTDPERRINWEHLLQHPLFKSYSPPKPITSQSSQDKSPTKQQSSQQQKQQQQQQRGQPSPMRQASPKKEVIRTVEEPQKTKQQQQQQQQQLPNHTRQITNPKSVSPQKVQKQPSVSPNKYIQKSAQNTYKQSSKETIKKPPVQQQQNNTNGGGGSSNSNGYQTIKKPVSQYTTSYQRTESPNKLQKQEDQQQQSSAYSTSYKKYSADKSPTTKHTYTVTTEYKISDPVRKELSKSPQKTTKNYEFTSPSYLPKTESSGSKIKYQYGANPYSTTPLSTNNYVQQDDSYNKIISEIKQLNTKRQKVIQNISFIKWFLQERFPLIHSNLPAGSPLQNKNNVFTNQPDYSQQKIQNSHVNEVFIFLVIKYSTLTIQHFLDMLSNIQKSSSNIHKETDIYQNILDKEFNLFNSLLKQYKVELSKFLTQNSQLFQQNNSPSNHDYSSQISTSCSDQSFIYDHKTQRDLEREMEEDRFLNESFFKNYILSIIRREIQNPGNIPFNHLNSFLESMLYEEDEQQKIVSFTNQFYNQNTNTNPLTSTDLKAILQYKLEMLDHKNICQPVKH